MLRNIKDWELFSGIKLMNLKGLEEKRTKQEIKCTQKSSLEIAQGDVCLKLFVIKE